MPVHQTSKIQIRRGLKENLPQLASGELGWAIDTQELYIGTGQVSEGAPYEGVVLVNGGGTGDNSTSRNFSTIPTGLINGINRIFVLPVIPILLFLYRNGLFQTPGSDFTIIGDTITFSTPLDIGESFYAQGFY